MPDRTAAVAQAIRLWLDSGTPEAASVPYVPCATDERRLAPRLDPTDEYLLNAYFGGDVAALRDFKARLVGATEGGLTSAKLSKMLERSSPFMQAYKDRAARKAACRALNYLHSSITDAAKGPEVQQWAANVHQAIDEGSPAEGTAEPPSACPE